MPRKATETFEKNAAESQLQRRLLKGRKGEASLVGPRCEPREPYNTEWGLTELTRQRRPLEDRDTDKETERAYILGKIACAEESEESNE